MEPIFHPDSYGYRPERSALDAVGACRQRCWRVRLGHRSGCAEVLRQRPWDLVVKAVEAHTDDPWVVLYVKRWLAAPLEFPDGTLQQRDRGTPQGSAVSPVLANLFMHYAFDAWMAREFPTIRFERYADDAVVHCVSECQATTWRRRSRTGWPRSGCGCTRQDQDRVLQGRQPARRSSSTRRSRSWGTRSGPRARGEDGKVFTSFLPAISKDALKRLSGAVRVAASPPDRAHLRRVARADQPDHARLDALLRGLLPHRAVPCCTASTPT